MRISFKALVVVLVAVAALAQTALADSPAPKDVVLTFRHRTAEGVLFQIELKGTQKGATYEAFLAEGEHMSERSGTVPAQKWSALLTKAESLVGADMAREVGSSDPMYEVVVKRGDQERVARFIKPATDREKEIAHLFDPKAPLGRVYDSLVHGIRSH